MTIRELANEAAKAGKLDARIIISTAEGMHDVDQVGFISEYHARYSIGSAVIKNIAFVKYKDKSLKFVDRGHDDGYFELED